MALHNYYKIILYLLFSEFKAKDKPPPIYIFETLAEM